MEALASRIPNTLFFEIEPTLSITDSHEQFILELLVRRIFVPTRRMKTQIICRSCVVVSERDDQRISFQTFSSCSDFSPEVSEDVAAAITYQMKYHVKTVCSRSLPMLNHR